MSDQTAREQSLLREIEKLEKEVMKWRRIRTPTHGSCCTCRYCGQDYDTCRCDLDEVADELDQVKKQLSQARREEREACVEIVDGECYGDVGLVIPEDPVKTNWNREMVRIAAAIRQREGA